jgi:hypothetical protein
MRRRQERLALRARRIALFALLGVGVAITLLLTAFGPGATARVGTTAPAPAKRLLPTGPPTPLTVATQGSLRLQLPVPQSRVTAIGYHGAGDTALALHPLGRQGNEGLLTRVLHRVFGGGNGGLVWYQLGGGSGPSTGSLDVGASAGTAMYSPVDGTVVGLTDYVVNNRVYGRRIDIQPSAAPSVVVSLTHLRPDQSLSVGSTVAAGTSKLGTLLNLAAVEGQALAHFTNDAGNHVSVEVHSSATLALP